MSSTTPASTTPASLLLSLPAALLSHILQHLEPRELITTLTRTTKHPAFHRFVEGAGPNDLALWTQLLRRRLARFTPARAWFGLRKKPESCFEVMSERYPSCAQKAESKLAAVLQAAGVPETQWEWEAEGISHVNAWRLFFLPASVAAGRTMADFRAWTEAFACSDCGEHRSATRQCAVCGKLLCGDCARGCGSEEHDDCPFALCDGCATRHVRNVGDYMIADHRTAPEFIVPSCPMCPYTYCCVPHAEVAYIFCPGCDAIRCPSHRLFSPGMISMCMCGAIGCTRPGCRPPGQYFRLCQSCFLQTCNRCEEQSGGRCRDCGGGADLEGH